MKKLLTMIIACLVLSAISVRPVAASSNVEKEVRFAGKVKSGIEKLGSGRDTRVEVKLRDKTRLKGYVSEIGETEFVVTDAKTGASNKVAYADVAQVKGNNLSTGAKIGIGIGIGVGLTILVVLLIIASND
ncbi:MAG TPA: hypothetical protein VMZ30_16795 [Pyrinomonadaceae bacterium]|nr:hypothetical protein [Pyrinomonadaceae bacterium]